MKLILAVILAVVFVGCEGKEPAPKARKAASTLTPKGQAIKQLLSESRKCTATWGKDSSKAGQNTQIFDVILFQNKT